MESVELHRPRKNVFAPMVRVSLLPMRLLALEYGADSVYSPEIIDRRFIDSIRIENEILGTVDFIDKRKPSLVILRIHPAERDRLVVQMGTSNAENAYEAALKMKVPRTQERDSEQGTVDLIKVLQDAGASAITIHCRKPSDRTSTEPDYSIIEEVLNVARVPITINGGLKSLSDADRLEQIHGENNLSFMFATAAMKNVSVFKRETLTPLKVAQLYVMIAIAFETHGKDGCKSTIVASKSYEEICGALGMYNFIELIKLNDKKKLIDSLDLKLLDEFKNVKQI